MFPSHERKFYVSIENHPLFQQTRTVEKKGRHAELGCDVLIRHGTEGGLYMRAVYIYGPTLKLERLVKLSNIFEHLRMNMA